MIRIYRERWSGRGPFSRMRCTFEGLESCSAFGLRIVEESPSTWTALARIRRRLHRCRDLSLYRLAEGDLGWGRGYDDLVSSKDGIDRLDQDLQQDGETDMVRAAVLRAGNRLLGRLEQGALPLVRDAKAVRSVHRRRAAWRAGAAAVLGGVACCTVGVGEVFVPATFGLGCLGVLWGTWRSRSLVVRLQEQEILARIEGPDTGHWIPHV